MVVKYSELAIVLCQCCRYSLAFSSQGADETATVEPGLLLCHLERSGSPLPSCSWSSIRCRIGPKSGSGRNLPRRSRRRTKTSRPKSRSASAWTRDMPCKSYHSEVVPLHCRTSVDQSRVRFGVLYVGGAKSEEGQTRTFPLSSIYFCMYALRPAPAMCQ